MNNKSRIHERYAITTNYRLISNCAILDQTVYETIFCTSSSKILYSSDKKNAIPVIRRKLPYSREQKHVSISDTPMLLIEINSISNMGCQK